MRRCRARADAESEMEPSLPTYICRAPEALFTATTKAQIAACITDIHAEVTGGARKFIQVMFRGSRKEDCYIAGKVLEGPHCIIQGHIRAGRSAVERAAIIRALLPKISEILGVPRYALWVYLSELPPRAMAEFGHMLPEPGDDEQWLAALPEEDRKRLEQL